METFEILKLAANTLNDKKAMQMQAIDIAEISDIADYFLICTATSNAHIRALADEVEEKLKEGRASMLSEKHARGEVIHIEDIIDAVIEEDVLAIEVVEEIGTVLGRAIAGLINIFNPELIIIGGNVSTAKEYLLLPIKSAIQKHSLNIINSDTTIKLSKLGKKAGSIGSCMLSRSKLLGLL